MTYEHITPTFDSATINQTNSPKSGCNVQSSNTIIGSLLETKRFAVLANVVERQSHSCEIVHTFGLSHSMIYRPIPLQLELQEEVHVDE